MLGAWVSCETAGSILDIGSGSGILALMCAQRNPAADITALEPDFSSLEEARTNFARSPWQNRLFTMEDTFENYKPSRSFDFIICNPPYFQGSLPSPSARKNAARHMHESGFSVLADRVSQWLSPEGKFGFILPVKEYEQLARELTKSGLTQIRTMRILPKPGYEQKLRMVSEWGKQPHETRTEPDLFIRNEKGEYSIEYRKLTEEFYLSRAY